MGNNMKSVLFILLALAISKSLAGHLITDCGGIVDLYEEHSCRTVPGNTQLDNEGGSNTPVATCDDVRQVYVDNTCCADNPHKHLSDQSKLYEWCMTDTIHPVLTHSGPATTTLKVGETFTDVGATCTDNCADALSVLKSGVVDTSTWGTYTLTYDCIDKAHNGATQITRVVIVECGAGEVVQNGACVPDCDGEICGPVCPAGKVLDTNGVCVAVACEDDATWRHRYQPTWGCAEMVTQGKCANGGFTPGGGLNNANSGMNGSPHLHCCACGKGA